MSEYFLVVSLNPVLQETWTAQRVGAGETGSIGGRRSDVAGKGVNTTRVLSQLSERAVNLTHLGGSRREEFLNLAHQDGVTLRWADSNSEVRSCHTFLGRDEYSATEIVEEGTPVGPATEQRVRVLFTELVQNAHSVIITGSKAPGYSDELLPWMVRLAKSRSVKVMLDIRGPELLRCLLFHPDVVKINVAEFGQTFLPETQFSEDMELNDLPADFWSNLRSAEAEYGCAFVLTNGSKPLVYTDNGQIQTLRPEELTPVNTIGSGDAAMAGLAAGLARDLDLRAALELAVDCAARNALREKPGTIL